MIFRCEGEGLIETPNLGDLNLYPRSPRSPRSLDAAPPCPTLTLSQKEPGAHWTRLAALDEWRCPPMKNP
jgi:hypothetical protein